MNINLKLPLIYGAIILLTVFTLFYNLDDRLLWADEAESALFAKNIIKFGVPRVDYGENLISLTGRDFNEEHIWIDAPWLHNYMTALSFVALGETTFTARLPFVITSLFSVLFLAFLAHRIYQNHELTISAVLLYITCTAFLLHSRQCRYYSVLMFAQIWLIYGYWLLCTGKSCRGVIHITLALIVQFYCNYLPVVINILSLCIVAIVLFRRCRRLLWTLPICFAFFGIFALPWCIYARLWEGSQHFSFVPEHLLVGASYYISRIHLYILPVAILLIPPVVYFVRLIKRQDTSGTLKKKKRDELAGGDEELKFGRKKIEVFLWILIPMHVLVLSTFFYMYFRYMITLIPVLALLAVIILIKYIKPRVIRYSIIALLCLSNAVSVVSAYPFNNSYKFDMPYVRFIRSITTEYQDRLEDIVSFFKQNADPNESVFAYNGEFALIYYTDMRVINGQFTNDVMLFLADWILTENVTGLHKFFYPSKEKFESLLPLEHYEPITISVHDSSGDASRPDPSLHTYFTTPKMTDVVIYKKKTQ